MLDSLACVGRAGGIGDCRHPVNPDRLFAGSVTRGLWLLRELTHVALRRQSIQSSDIDPD